MGRRAEEGIETERQREIRHRERNACMLLTSGSIQYVFCIIHKFFFLSEWMKRGSKESHRGERESRRKMKKEKEEKEGEEEELRRSCD